MCYIDGQNNKYSVLNECNRMLKYKIYNKHLLDLQSSPSIIRIIKSKRMRLAGHGARIWGGEMNACKLLERKPGRRRQLRGLRRKLVHHIKMDLGEMDQVV
jgi:hypothetical protein